MGVRRTDASWMGLALCAALLLAGVVLAILGTGERGTNAALAATARLSFLLFWAAYSGGALAAVFGPIFHPLKRRAREFGLAFAAAHLVHIALVAWLCRLGHVPHVVTFVVFGIALIFTYLLALFSIESLRQKFGSRWWWFLRTVGMNYIAYAFFIDFLKHPFHGDIKHVVEYLPFIILAAVGPLLRLVSWTLRIQHQRPKSDEVITR